jgi:3-phosphoshikimate 1-carboxyvinyltransferase
VSRARIAPRGALCGEVKVPGDKSITQRAILLGALAPGVTRIRGANTGEDARAALAMTRQLGARVTASVRDGILIKGGTLRESDRVLDARNSGTALRLATGLLSAQPFLSILTGDPSLRRRPVARVIEPLRVLGADLTARQGDRLPPIVVRGRPLQGAAVQTSVPSAQVKSAVLLAGIQASGVTSVREPLPTRDHTERMLPRFGVPVERDGTAARVRGPASLQAAEIDVPGDFSAASFLLAAAAIVRGSDIVLKGVGVNPTRIAFLEHLAGLGSGLERGNERMVSGEPVSDLRIRAGKLRGARILREAAPRLIDELPLVAVLAAFADGTTVVHGADELRVKESDRVATVTAGLRAIGVEVDEHPDGWTIHGRAGRVRGGTVDAAGDHRIAMAFMVAGLAAREGVTVLGAESARVSDPGFLSRLRGLFR